jgi:hypothetical protein
MDGPVPKHVIQSENDRLRAEVERLTRERDEVVGSYKHVKEWAHKIEAQLIERNACIDGMAVSLTEATTERDAAERDLAAAERKLAMAVEALKPFAKDAERHSGDDQCHVDGTPYEKRSRILVGDLRNARATLAELEKADG